MRVLTLGISREQRDALALALGEGADLIEADADGESDAAAVSGVDALLTAPRMADQARALASELRRSSPQVAWLWLTETDEDEASSWHAGADAASPLRTEGRELAAGLARLVAERRDRKRWPRSFAERRVLLVADAIDTTARPLVWALERAGYQVVAVSGAERGLRALREGTHQVVLLDASRGVLDLADTTAAVLRFDAQLGCFAIANSEAGALKALAAGAYTATVGRPNDEELAESVDRAWIRTASLSASAQSPSEHRDARTWLLWLELEPAAELRQRVVELRPEWQHAVAKNSDEALALMQQREVDLVLMNGTGQHAREHLARLGLAPRPALALALRDESVDLAWGQSWSGAGSDASWLVCRIEKALREVRLERRIAALAQRLHEVDSRRVELIKRLADMHLELERVATVDSTTEVLNRRGLEAALERELEAARRIGGSITACIADCDDFQRINEQFSDAGGDLVLRNIAERLKGSLRITDTLGRIGGDEFLMLLPQTRLAEALQVAERARISASSRPVALADGPVRVAVSIGVADVPWDSQNLEDILPTLRTALAESKSQGKNQVSGHGNSLKESIDKLVGQLSSGTGLRALMQPIVRVADEKVVGYEVLTRAHAGLFEAPEQFLRIAREQGILTKVDLQCLKVCMKAAEEVPADMHVHVNLFPTTLLDVATEDLVRLFRIDGGAEICLELSEEQFIGDPRELTDRIAALRSAGVKLAIDDVGKGRGTLDSVVVLEPDSVKIDKELICGAFRDIRKERLLRRLVSVARAMRCEVVGEGVETAEDLALMRELEVPYAQGYYWSKPLSLRELGITA